MHLISRKKEKNSERKEEKRGEEDQSQMPLGEELAWV